VNQLHLEEYGSGPVLVLGHGVIQSASIFAPALPYLTDHFRVVLWDAPGHGKSPDWTAGYSHEQLADDLAAALSERGITRAIVGGVSQGGWIGMQTALRHPRLVSGLVLISCTAHPQPPQTWAQIRQGPRTWEETGLTDDYIAYQTLTNLGPESPHAPAWEADMRSFDSGKVVAVYEALLARPSLLNRLAEVHVPALVVRAENDPWVPAEESDAMAAALNTSVHTIAGGHTLTLTHPQLMAELIVEFARESAIA
jgi:pimeloyl-ACP methyl ester carboxylesterase